MQGFKYSIELFKEEKYRELDYGIIFYVPGKKTPELNAYVKKHARSIAKLINLDDEFWVQCRIKYLDSDNDLFAQQDHALFYSAMLPTKDNFHEGYSFLVATLDDLRPEVMDRAFEKFFKTLLRMFDEVLDTGNYDESELLFPEMVQFDEEELHCECISLADGAAPISGLPPRERPRPVRRTALSRLEITPATYQVLLPDYGKEIHFTAQVKALYVLFLNHPEGIRMKEIGDYKDEYLKLYLCFTNRSEDTWLNASVEKLLDVYNRNALDVKKSQCNETIRRIIPEENIRSYYEIEVNRGRPHRIKLNRSLVSMPESLL